MMELPGVPAPTGLLWAAAAGAAALVLIVLLCRRLPKKARRAVFAHCLAAALGAFGLALALGESPASPPDAGTVTTETAPSQPETAPAPSETEPSLPETLPAPSDDAEFVRVADYIPGIRVELAYATENNFTGQVIYDFQDAYLRYGTVKKLAAVQEALEARGMGLKIWDAFRPPEAQFRLWEICPDPAFVADPNRGFSSHSRGSTVDVTLTDSQGGEIPMPTAFDDFTALADRDYSDCPDDARENALLLENLMTGAGFTPYRAEWWHFSDGDSYEVEHDFRPGA